MSSEQSGPTKYMSTEAASHVTISVYEQSRIRSEDQSLYSCLNIFIYAQSAGVIEKHRNIYSVLFSY